MTKRQKISLDAKYRPEKGYRHSGAEGYSNENGNLAFGTDEDWKTSKLRRNKKQSKSLF